MSAKMKVTATSNASAIIVNAMLSQFGFIGVILSVGSRLLMNSMSQQNKMLLIIRSPSELKTKLEL